MLANRRIVLGVTGGIAAYKAVLLCRMLVDAGAHVIPVLTESAQRFVGRATFDALASELTRTSIFDDPDPIPHTTLGQTADLIVVAPATARSIGSYANGISNDLLTATLIATRAPVVVCPAMHTEMWEHPAVQDNLTLLEARGVHIVSPVEGRLAGGDLGAGRLAEPEAIFETIDAILSGGDLQGHTVVVTAGGTREAIDPVRYVGNRSTGKQGYAVAEEAQARGADVTLISTVETTAPNGIEIIYVESAAQMRAAVLERSDADVIVMAAAVADFRPIDPPESKMKK
ncbi:MAG: bifunctional phosphopantothenoylcysteine decarboxylase/phosphopantothenate--cysteine ligase CoaBC, partial [Actinomycetota bacterium]|nr:bifunctional phosphopantothenoylcysteine decarboxylase/phosphopantothenate--cysteine ligase CoaBC [Actinomycetota bacterium]